jgi:flagellar protein FlaJ
MPRRISLQTDPVTLAGIAGIVAGTILALYGWKAGVFRVQLVGILLAAASAVMGPGRGIISGYLGGPRVDLDLVYALLHMRLVASGKAPPGKVLGAVSDPDLYGFYSRIFGRAVLLAREWGYNLSDALSYLAKEIRDKAFREVVQRLAATIRLGASIEEFLSSEYDTLFSEYIYHYQRMMNNLRVLLGVYVAVMAALVFAVSSFTLLGFFFGGSSKLLVQAYVASLMVVTGLGASIILLLPREYFDVRGREARENSMVRLIDRSAVTGLLAGLVVAGLYIHRVGMNPRSLGLAMVIVGSTILPAGVLVTRYESFIHDIDVFFPVFIRSMGSFLATIPSLKHAVSQVLRADLGRLTRLIERFYARILNEVPPQIAWKRFSIESGSELVRRGTRIFQDVVEYGGDTTMAGRMISDHNNSLLGLRRLRGQVSSNFISTAIVIHATVIAISIFIAGLVSYFNSVLKTMMGQLTPEAAEYFFLSPVNMEFIDKSIYVFSSALTIINAYLIALVRPYSLRAYWLYQAVILISSGISAYLSDVAVKYILSTMAGIQMPLPTTPTPG